MSDWMTEGSFDDFGAKHEVYPQARVKFLVNGAETWTSVDKNPHMTLHNLAENLVVQYYGRSFAVCELIYLNNLEGNRSHEDGDGPGTPAEILDGDFFDLYCEDLDEDEDWPDLDEADLGG
jgi:hypothetical protein